MIDNYQNTEEINLMDLFWSVLKSWKVLLAAFLIGGVLLGLFGAFREYRLLSNEAVLESRKEAYEAALETYEMNKAQLETDLKNLQDARERQEFYQNNALMLAMDQYNIWFITAAYSIEVDPQPAETDLLGRLNYASAMLKRYQAKIAQIDLDKVIATAEQPELTAVNPAGRSRKLLEVSTDDMTSVLNLTIRADSRERAEKIYDAVKETVGAEEKELAAGAGSAEVFRLVTVSENSYAGVDTEFGTIQTNFKNGLKTVSDAITETQNSLSSLKKPSGSVPTVTSVLKKAVKYGAVGAVAGLFAAAFFLLVKIVMQDRLISTEDTERRYHLPLLGTISLNGKKTGRLDNAIAKHLGFIDRSAETAAELAASRISLRLKEESKILLIGSCGTEKLNAVKEKLASRLPGVEIAACGNVAEDPAALAALRADAAVVCVEEWMLTPHKQIRRELQTAADCGSQNLGIVIIA